jgi:hypothetical protein
MSKEDDYEAFMDCMHSTQNEYHCHYDSEKGENVCEGVKRVVRHCPGKAPEVISEERVESDASMGMGNLFGFGSNIMKSMQLGKFYVVLYVVLII